MRTRVFAVGLALVALQGCGAARAAAPSATLPADSVELLRQALERVRPAFPTQAEALRSGIYDRTAAPAAAQPAPPIAPDHPRRSDPDPPRRLPPSAPPERPAEPHRDPPEAETHRFGIQIAAFRDAASADIAAAEARRSFPDLTVSATQAEGWFRVIVMGWARETDAAAALPAIRSRYPSAWIRGLALP